MKKEAVVKENGAQKNTLIKKKNNNNKKNQKLLMKLWAGLRKLKEKPWGRIEKKGQVKWYAHMKPVVLL